MKMYMRTLAALAVALPGLAFAGEPVPMTDSDLDSVAAGFKLSSLSQYSSEQILADPRYSQASSKALARYEGLNESQRAKVALRVEKLWPTLSSADQAKLRAVTPAGLQHLLPK